MATIQDFYLRDIKHREDFFRTANGDLELEDGLDNIKNQLLRRLITVPGSIIHRPDYGVGIHQYQNVTLTLSVKERIALSIRNNFEEDDRVVTVTSVSFERDDDKPETFKVTAKVELVGFGEQEIEFKPFEG